MIPLLMSSIETSDGSKRTFFITGWIGSITGLKDPYVGTMVWLIVDGFNVNESLFNCSSAMTVVFKEIIWQLWLLVAYHIII